MARVAYEEGKRLVDDQLAELDSMRQRSVQFLAFVGSATAFLVGTGLASTVDDRPSGWLLSAAAASSLTVIMLLLEAVILLSLVSRTSKMLPTRHEWNFRLEPKVIVKAWVNRDLGAAPEEIDLYVELAEHYSDMADENDHPLAVMRTCYWLFLVVAFAQLMAWGALVWISG